MANGPGSPQSSDLYYSASTSHHEKSQMTDSDIRSSDLAAPPSGHNVAAAPPGRTQRSKPLAINIDKHARHAAVSEQPRLDGAMDKSSYQAYPQTQTGPPTTTAAGPPQAQYPTQPTTSPSAPAPAGPAGATATGSQQPPPDYKPTTAPQTSATPIAPTQSSNQPAPPSQQAGPSPPTKTKDRLEHAAADLEQAMIVSAEAPRSFVPATLTRGTGPPQAVLLAPMDTALASHRARLVSSSGYRIGMVFLLVLVPPVAILVGRRGAYSQACLNFFLWVVLPAAAIVHAFYLVLMVPMTRGEVAAGVEKGERMA